MKHLKYFDDFSLNEDMNTNPTTVTLKVPGVGDIVVNYTYKNTKERTAKYEIITKFEGESLDQRGTDLFNKAVMDKPTEQLNINIDSERLEYAWDYISQNLTKALTDKKIEVKGVLIADNILKEGENVVFNFTFKDKDSVQNTDPSGKTTKKILAGKIKPGRYEKQTVVVNQVAMVTDLKIQSNEPRSNNKLDVINNSINLQAQGYGAHDGTYWYIEPKHSVWFTYKTNQEIADFMAAKKVRFDMLDLYKKFGISSDTKKVVGPINQAIQLKS